MTRLVLPHRCLIISPSTGRSKLPCVEIDKTKIQKVMNRPTFDIGGQGDARGSEGFRGSVMPNGSLSGIISGRYFKQELRTEQFRL